MFNRFDRPDGYREETRPRLPAFGCIPNSGVETTSRGLLSRSVSGKADPSSATFEEPNHDATRRRFAALGKSVDSGHELPNVGGASTRLSKNGLTGAVLDAAGGEDASGR